jgi:hypothetical protein
VAIELCQVIEARQRGAEVRAQAAADLAFDLRGAGKQPQPELERRMVARMGACLVPQFLGFMQQRVGRIGLHESAPMSPLRLGRSGLRES